MVAIAIGGWLFLRGKNPAAKRHWYPRLTAINSVIVFSLMSIILVAWQQPTGIIFIAVFGSLITYLSVTRTRVCEKCGRVSQPQNLISAPEFCPKCGAPLAADPWVKRWWPGA